MYETIVDPFTLVTMRKCPFLWSELDYHFSAYPQLRGGCWKRGRDLHLHVNSSSRPRFAVSKEGLFLRPQSQGRPQLPSRSSFHSLRVPVLPRTRMPNEASDWHGKEQRARGEKRGICEWRSDEVQAHTIKGEGEGLFPSSSFYC